MAWKTRSVLLCVALSLWSKPACPEGRKDPEVYMNATQIIERWGYQALAYDAVTEDGYILTLVRILPNANKWKSERPVIFLQHGLESSCVDWVNNLPGQSAGFYFADAGFDVWLGNFRGNLYARRHRTLKPQEKEFWRFTWDEMAKYDLPALVGKALEISKADKLYYVGHSEGTLTAFAKFSTDQQFADKVHTFFALAPVVTVKYIKGPSRFLSPLVKNIQASDDDEEDIDQQIQSLMKSTRRVTEGPGLSVSVSGGQVAIQGNQQALEKAKQLARQINMERNIGVGAKDVTQQTAEAVLKGATTGPVNVSAKTIAQQLAEKLNEKLNYVPSEAPQQEQQQVFSRYEEELEINDFPQQVRWRITSRETLSQIQEYAEVGISVKGSYVPPGKEPKEGDRRLYLCIEATSELSIGRARAEIVRVLKEELRKLASMSSAQMYNKAKYRVV